MYSPFYTQSFLFFFWREFVIIRCKMKYKIVYILHDFSRKPQYYSAEPCFGNTAVEEHQPQKYQTFLHSFAVILYGMIQPSPISNQEKNLSYRARVVIATFTIQLCVCLKYEVLQTLVFRYYNCFCIDASRLKQMQFTQFSDPHNFRKKQNKIFK